MDMRKSDRLSPFRQVWVELGRLRERPEVEDSPEVRELGRRLAIAIGEAEQDWRRMARVLNRPSTDG